MTSTTQIVSSIVSHLGGPLVDPVDVEWALDFPAGRALVSWLADQLREDIEIDNDENEALLYQSALEGIALEMEEAQILKRVKAERLEENEPTSPDYVLPSKTRDFTDCMSKESALLENEATLLKQRLRQTKMANQSTAKAIKSLRRAIENADNEIQQSQDRLSKLSITADMAIAGSTAAAIQALESHRDDSNAHLDTSHPQIERGQITWHASLASLSAVRSRLVSSTESQLDQLSEWLSSIPSAEEVNQDARRLNGILNHPTTHKATNYDRNKTQNAANNPVPIEIFYQEELVRMCEMLDNGVTVNNLLGMLNADPVDRDFDGGDNVVDVKGVLEQAWSLDHERMLATKNKILDNTLEAFKARLITPLTQVHDALSKTDQRVREVEAVVGALGEELEEIVDDVQLAKESRHLALESATMDERTLVDGISALLKKLKGLRATDAPPLVLLDRTDIMAEVHSVINMLKTSEHYEGELVTRIRGNLDAASSSRTALVSQIYRHSPMNTSPPFMPPLGHSSLEQDIRMKARDFGETLGKLQKESEVFQDNRTRKKLGAFVDKWGAS